MLVQAIWPRVVGWGKSYLLQIPGFFFTSQKPGFPNHTLRKRVFGVGGTYSQANYTIGSTTIKPPSAIKKERKKVVAGLRADLLHPPLSSFVR